MIISQALPSTPTIWNRATCRARDGSHHSSSIGQGPAQASIGIARDLVSVWTKRGHAGDQTAVGDLDRPVIGIRAPRPARGAAKTRAGAGGGMLPGHGRP